MAVVSASDVNSWIKIDPANSRILAAGGAGPLRRIIIPSARIYASASNSAIGQYLVALSVTEPQLGGFYLTPILVPDDMDVTKPCKFKILISPAANATTNGQVIRFSLAETHVADGGTRTETTLNYDWNVPDNWATTNNNLVTIDSGGGSTFAGNTFAHGQLIGFRIARNGPASQDTFDKGVNIGEYALLEYTAEQY